MIVSRAKPLALIVSFVLVAFLACAGTGFAAPSDRAASFLPPSADEAAKGAPIVSPPPAASAVPDATTPNAPAPAPAAAETKPADGITINAAAPPEAPVEAPSEPGLGPAMWKNTPRAMVERLLPTLNLPTQSMALNNLARHFLLTPAAPEGVPATADSLLSMRAEKLVALGDAADAWKLIVTSKEAASDSTWHLVAENAVANPAIDTVCTRAPDLMKNHPGDWQKLQVICALRMNDIKTAQPVLDLMQTQSTRDATFVELAVRTIIGGAKQLPRQLTPLKPTTLALLRMADLPVRSEVYAHPDPSLAPELLKTKAVDESARLALADRMAARGVISADELADVYRSQTFSAADLLTASGGSRETGPRLHALLYQAAQQEKKLAPRVDLALKMIAGANPEDLNGVLPRVAADAIGDIQPSAEFNALSPDMARLYILANKPDAALAWVKLAQAAAPNAPKVAASLQNLWPLIVVAGLGSDQDYARDRAAWLDSALKAAPSDQRAARVKAASILLLLDATGFAVSEEDWARVADMGDFEKRALSPAFILERMRAAGSAGRRGEAVLFALLANGKDDAAFSVTVQTVRALRQAGLTPDAAGLAREAAVILLGPLKP